MMLKHLKELTALSGIPGQENAVRDYILKALSACGPCVQVKTDALGNVLAEVTGEQRPAQKVMFEAHMDEVGMIVTGITSEGYLRFANAGGINEKVQVGRTVTVNGHVGVIGCKAMHHCSKEEREKPVSADSLLIDIGAACREEAEAVVSIGDAVLFDSEFAELSGGRFKARALDDRVGCALLLSLAEQVLPYDVTLVFAVQEEIGLRGSATAAFAVQPDVSVTLEATTASDIAGTQPGHEVCFVGQGPVLSFMDGRTLYDQKLYHHILDLARENGIPAQSKTAVAGGNDAGAIQVAGRGARVAAVSLPCRYIHSASCVLAEQDVDAAGQLVRLLAGTLPGETA